MANDEDDFRHRITIIFDTTWDSRDGTVCPETEDVKLEDGAVKLDAVLLYADLYHSTELVTKLDRSVAAKIIRAFLSSMTTLVNDNGGYVRSFDGDRVMGVFLRGSKNSAAARCALKMNYVVGHILRPAAAEKFSSLAATGLSIQHCVGVASSQVFVVRGGVRGSNDLVFVGTAPNIAAKLSEIRTPSWHTYISAAVYKKLNANSKLSDGVDMWNRTTRQLDKESHTVYRSTYRWEP